MARTKQTTRKSTGSNSSAAAYWAYRSLGRVPHDAPFFPFDDNGYPIIGPYEVFCRMPGRNGMRHCNVNGATTAGLCRHLEAQHGASRTYRPILYARPMKGLQIVESRGFYEDLMKNEEYPDKRVPNVPGRDNGRRAPPARAVVAREDDEDDEEPKYIKREEDGMAGREIVELDSSPTPEREMVKTERNGSNPPRQGEIPIDSTRVKRKRTTTSDTASDDDEDYLKAQLVEKKAKLEMMEAAFEVAELERKLAARQKK